MMKTNESWFFISRWTKGTTNQEYREKKDVKYGTDKGLLRQMSCVSFKNSRFDGILIQELKGKGKKVDRDDLAKKHKASY